MPAINKLLNAISLISLTFMLFSCSEKEIEEINEYSNKSGSPTQIIFNELITSPVQAPGTSVDFSKFINVAASGTDNIAFVGSTPNGSGFWGGSASSLQKVATNTEKLPDASFDPAINFVSSYIYIAPTGEVVFNASDGQGEGGLWAGMPGSIQMVAMLSLDENNSKYFAPGTDGALFNGLKNHTINDKGEVAFNGILNTVKGNATFETREGIWAGKAGSLKLVVRGGDNAAGTSDKFRKFVALDYANHIAFVGDLASDYRKGIWVWDGSKINLIALAGNEAPGITDSELEDPSQVRVNNAGNLAIIAKLKPGVGGVTTDNDFALYSGKPGSLQLIAREGDPADGGHQFGGFSKVLQNEKGDLGIIAGKKSGGMGIWVRKGNEIKKIMSVGDPVPGIEGATFKSFSEERLNENGDVAFLAFIEGPDIDSDHDEALFITKDGVLKMMLREFDLLESNGKKVSSIRLHKETSGDGTQSCFLADGRLVFTVGFADNTGAILVGSAEYKE